MTVVRALSAGGDDERVIRELGAVREHDAPRCRVDVDDFPEQHANVLLAAEDAAQRCRDLAGRERAGSDLIKERLEQVIVAPIDERHVDRRGLQRARRAQAAKATADDHHLCLHASPVRAMRVPLLSHGLRMSVGNGP